MLSLDITYKGGEKRHITNNLNMEQLKALVRYVEKGTGAFAHFEEIKITNIDKN